MLAVVEDHDRGAAREPLQQRRLAAGHVDRREHRVEDLVRRRRGFEPHQPRRLRERASRRDRDRGLPDAARADDLDEPLLRQQAGQGGDVLLAADEPGRQRRQVPRGRRRSRRDAIRDAQRRILPEDLALELLQPRSGIEPELVGQQRPDPLVRRQRVGLATRPVERRDQQRPQALLERVGGHRRLQLADQVAGVAQLQQRGEPDLDQLHPRLVEPRPVRDRPVAVAGAREEVAAVQVQGRLAQLGGAAVVAGVEPPRRGGRVAQGDERVDLRRLGRELVAVLAAGDHERIPERAAQPGDLRLQRVPARVGGPVPQLVDEPVGPDEQPGVEREAHQQLRRLAARHRQGLTVACDLNRAQHRDPQHRESVWPAAGRGPGVSGVSAGPRRLVACRPSSPSS